MRSYILPALLVMAMTGAPLSADEGADRFDAVTAAPDSHEVLLENDHVRVLHVVVAPGTTEPIHDHRWPSVMYFEQAQPITYITYALVDGQPTETQRNDAPAEAMTGALAVPPEGLHAIYNRGSAPFIALRVEFKDTPPGK